MIDLVVHRVAVLGAGHIHVTDYLEALRQRSDARVVAVWDADTVRAEWAAAQADAPAVADPADALAAGPTLVVVCSETAQHRWLVDLAVRAGVALFVEKPLGLNATESRRIAEQVSAAGLRLGTGFFLRHVLALRRMRIMLSDGELGQLTAVHLSFTHNGGLLSWFSGYRQWMGDRARAGYGGFGDLALHLVDLVPFLISAGVPGGAPLTVRGAVLRSTRGGPVDDHGTALLSAGGELPITVTAGWVTAPGGLEVSVTGTAATARVHNGELIFTASGQAPACLVDDDPPAAARGLIAFLDGEEEPDAMGRAVAAAEIVDAVYGRRRVLPIMEAT